MVKSTWMDIFGKISDYLESLISVLLESFQFLNFTLGSSITIISNQQDVHENYLETTVDTSKFNPIDSKTTNNKNSCAILCRFLFLSKNQ